MCNNVAVRSYGPDTDLTYVCTVTLTFEIWRWVLDNNCVKYYLDLTRGLDGMTG